MVYDKLGNRCWLEYEYMVKYGYIYTGFRFDSHCNHVDKRGFPIFKKTLDNLKLSCNYLIEPEIGLNIPNKILELSDQINLLSFKPKGKLTESAKENFIISIMYLNTIKPIVVDNCLEVQLGYISKCKRGKEFVHVYPDGKVVDCCFQSRCYLWK